MIGIYSATLLPLMICPYQEWIYVTEKNLWHFLMAVEKKININEGTKSFR